MSKGKKTQAWSRPCYLSSRFTKEKINKMELINKKIIEITPLAPFNFDATFHKPAHFESGDNRWQPGVRWQTFLFQKESLGVKFINQGEVENPKIIVEIYSQEKLADKFVGSFIKEVSYRYNLNLDLGNFIINLKMTRFWVQ